MAFPLPLPMRVALDLAAEAAIAGEVPVGACIVHQGEIVATSANAMRTAGDPTAHAEIVAIRRAAEALGTSVNSTILLHNGTLSELPVTSPDLSGCYPVPYIHLPLEWCQKSFKVFTDE